MKSLFLIAPIVLSFLILIIPAKVRYYYSLAVLVYAIAITSLPALSIFLYNITSTKIFIIGLPFRSVTFTIDSLSAFFILITNFTVLTGMLYSKGYLRSYLSTKNPFEISLHYFSYIWLYFSMLGVLMLRDGIPFLIAWELMAVSSFMLVLFEGEKQATLKTAVTYLIQMHVGFIFLLIAFLICEAHTGTMSFDALQNFFAVNNNIPLFLLFFAGFAIKAGFMPLHTWLPNAHPAAPSHVSGVMSGVMIKMGIYGIVRVLTYIQYDIYSIGLFILIISAISGVLGVMMAIVQHDLKKLLAYHSIENIGIIGIGIGLGTIGIGLHNSLLIILGFSGGLLHVLNHSLFKSLLFFSAGSVYKTYHTRSIDQLGGVIHKMPKTAALFLIASIAICGLPPLNGFISEILIYTGLFKGLAAGFFYQSIIMLLALIALALIGGLAVFCFTKVFGVVFLGKNRYPLPEDAKEVNVGMLLPQALIALFILMIGLFPVFFIQPLIALITTKFHVAVDSNITKITSNFAHINLIGFILLSLIVILFYLRSVMMKKKTVHFGPTWGCGYTAGTERQQYTGTSYAANFSELAAPILQTQKKYSPILENEIFPAQRIFETHPQDIFRTGLNKLVNFVMMIMKRLARLQTGNIQHYILYAFVFILLIFVLLYLNIL